MKDYKQKLCKSCGEPFEPKVFWQRFCKSACRFRDLRKRKTAKGKKEAKK